MQFSLILYYFSSIPILPNMIYGRHVYWIDNTI